MDSQAPRIATISATSSAIPPAAEALGRFMPTAQIWNILDDRLLDDALMRGGVDSGLEGRMLDLIRYAEGGAADAILLTCSIYGRVARAYARRGNLVRGADEAAFEVIAGASPPQVCVVSALRETLTDSCRRLRLAMSESGVSVKVSGVYAPEAAGISHGGIDELARALIDAIRGSGNGIASPIFLAQYSLAPAAEALRSMLGVQVITGPESAARQLRQRLAYSGFAR